MSWNIGGILIGEKWLSTEASLLRELGLPVMAESKRMHITDTPELSPTNTAVAIGEKYTLVLNRLLPYDLSYAPPFNTPLDDRLKQLSEEAPVLAFFMDGITSTYGLCVFQEGKVVRAKKSFPGKMP